MPFFWRLSAGRLLPDPYSRSLFSRLLKNEHIMHVCLHVFSCLSSLLFCQHEQHLKHKSTILALVTCCHAASRHMLQHSIFAGTPQVSPASQHIVCLREHRKSRLSFFCFWGDNCSRRLPFHMRFIVYRLTSVHEPYRCYTICLF